MMDGLINENLPILGALSVSLIVEAYISLVDGG